MVTAFAYSGRIDFNVETDSLPINGSSARFRFTAPKSVELPDSFAAGKDLYQAPVQDAEGVTVKIDARSDRLQLLEPFKPWSKGSGEDVRILAKIKGKCTTDHISPAGPWYKYRGHLDNISNNMLLAASNEFLPSDPQMLGHTIHPVTNKVSLIHEVARDLRQHAIRWCIIGDWNYGEGSSREHAALEPRFLGGIAVIARSFARIHETNLKKQGMLPLTFARPHDYERIRLGNRITLRGVEGGELRPGKQVSMHVICADAGEWIAPLNHSYSEGQLKWLRAGSALNHIKQTTLGS
jgi:aconitate hydratase